MKKSIIICLLCAVIACLSVTPALANAYPIISDWAKEEVLLAQSEGLVMFPEVGLVSDQRAAATRDQAVFFVMRLPAVLLDREMENTCEHIFPDLENQFCRETVEKACSAGIIKGMDDGDFHPSDHVTRQQAACMYYRMLQYLEKELEVKVLPEPQENLPFTDEIAPWAKEAVGALSALGVAKGKADSRYAPDDDVTFEEMLVMSHRCFSLFQS